MGKGAIEELCLFQGFKRKALHCEKEQTTRISACNFLGVCCSTLDCEACSNQPPCSPAAIQTSLCREEAASMYYAAAAAQARALPPMRALVLVLKCYLKSLGLNEVATGGLSSYSLCNM
eukprot:scaffold144874_cov18-Tisochrysis_lutea.AAC.1